MCLELQHYLTGVVASKAAFCITAIVLVRDATTTANHHLGRRAHISDGCRGSAGNALHLEINSAGNPEPKPTLKSGHGHKPLTILLPPQGVCLSLARCALSFTLHARCQQSAP